MFGPSAYPSYTVFLAVATSALVVLVVMPFFIRLMRYEGMGQQIRADGPGTHLVKQGTPTMGGVVIILSVLVTVAIFAKWTSSLILALGVLLSTALLGLADDIESVSHGRSLGLTPTQKMVGLTAISVIFCLLATNWVGISPRVSFPGGLVIDLGVLTTRVPLGEGSFDIPWLFVLFVFLFVAGFANSVNLTDGLDGLSGGTVFVTMVFMAMIAYAEDILPLAVLAGAVAGACVGFIWYNCYPASIFMGDTGSLALGGVFAAMAILTKTEVASLIMGALFVVESLSVIIQVVHFKRTGKRIFLMSPLHHHFEKLGWSETKVVIRFWIVSAAFSTLGFALFFSLG